MSHGRPRGRSFASNLFGMLTMLMIQFLLGMAANLFVTITRHHPGANASEFFGGAAQSVFWAITQGPIILILHAIMGILLAINAVVLLVQAFRSGSTGARVFTIIGAIGIVGAGFNGASFLTYNHDVNSFIMAIGLALATIAYARILYAEFLLQAELASPPPVRRADA